MVLAGIRLPRGMNLMSFAKFLNDFWPVLQALIYLEAIVGQLLEYDRNEAYPV
jgi:hypothetical protein